MMRLAPGARRYALAALVVAVFAVFVSPWLSVLALAGGAFAVWFHRDPERTPPPEGVVAPADGTVTVIREEGGRLRVGTFMRVRDVHVNRAPLGGEVTAVEHEPGAHRPAFSKDSERNERVRIALGECEVTLIAGAFARRITPYVEPGDSVERGERIGHVSFGSRADVLFPPTVGRDDLRVAEGDRVRAGETVLAA